MECAFSKLRCWLIASLIALAGSLILFSQSPEFWQQQWIWDNEKLLPFDQLVLADKGASIFAMNLARIPSLAPDYLLAAFCRLMSNDIRIQYLTYVLIISALQILLEAALLARISKASLIISTTFIFFISFALGFASPEFSLNHSLASLPMNHGGNFLMVLLLLWLLLLHEDKIPPTAISHKQILAFMVCLLGTISNRIFFLQASLPGILVLSIQTNLDTKHAFSTSRGLPASLILGSSLGLLLSALLIRTGCTPPLSWNYDHLNLHLNDLFALRSSGLGAGWIVLLGAAICWKQLATSKKWPERSQEMINLCLFMISGLAFTSLVYPLIFANQGYMLGGNEVINIRYLFPFLLATPILLGHHIIATTGSLTKLRLMLLSPTIQATLLLSLALSMHSQLLDSLFAITRWSNPYAAFLQRSIPDNVAVLTPYEGGNEYLLSSRSLKAGNHWKPWVSQIAFDGTPNPWDQGKSEFYINQQTRQLRDYRALLIKSRDTTAALRWYGEPSKRITSTTLAAEIWLFENNSATQLRLKLRDSLMGRFQVTCSDH